MLCTRKDFTASHPVICAECQCTISILLVASYMNSRNETLLGKHLYLAV